MTERTAWEVQGIDYSNCNCSYGCPCQFADLPTHGRCEAVTAVSIERGHHGNVTLDGLRVAGIYRWPGPVHHGNGTMQVVIDERADLRQRAALDRILHGLDTDDVATMWWVYAAMCSTKLPPVFAPIELDADVDARRGSLRVPGLIESKVQPIKNPVSGADVRARIDLPHGFEFRLAEIASGRSRTHGAIALDLQDTFTLLARIHLSDKGVVDTRVAA